MTRVRGGLRVLVVDDDASIRSLVRQALGDEGHEVVEAADGAAALAAVERRGPFSLVLLDLAMPVMDGWQFAEQYWKLASDGVVNGASGENGARGSGGRAPLLVFTAEKGLAAAQHAERLRAVGFLTKPFDLSELVATVERCAVRATVRPESAPGEAVGGARAARPETGGKISREDVLRQQQVTRLRTHLERLQRDMAQVRLGVTKVAEIETSRRLTREEARWASQLRLESERLRLELQGLREEFFRLKQPEG